jgi:hypothetical protein
VIRIDENGNSQLFEANGKQFSMAMITMPTFSDPNTPRPNMEISRACHRLFEVARSDRVIAQAIAADVQRLYDRMLSDYGVQSPSRSGFDPPRFGESSQVAGSKSSHAWRKVTSRYGDGLNHAELLSVAEVVAYNLNVPLDREAKRRKSLLIKWFEDNMNEIEPFLDYVKLVDSNGCQITNDPI